MRSFFDPVLDIFEAVLAFLHGMFEPLTGVNAWGWSIIALTLIVRVLLLPLAIKQTRSMRAMQAIQPEMKALQKKYKVDRELMRKDPEQYRAKRAKLNEEMMALYKERGANPAASCLPLLAQAPVFLALFWTLNLDRKGVFETAPFYFITNFISPESQAEGITGLAAQVSQAGWPGWALILLMSGTMYWTQRQMMARTALTQGGENPMAQQQKILLYAMPIFLAVISFQFPLGILLYWVTTNIWQVAQQAIILREVRSEQDTGQLGDKPGGTPSAGAGESRRSPGASSGTKPVKKDRPSGKDDASGSKKGSDTSAKGSGGAKDTGKDRPKDQGKAASSGKGGQSKSGDKNKNKNKNQQRPQGGASKGKAAAGDSGEGSSNGQKPGKGTSDGQGGSSADRPKKRDHLPRRPRR